MNEKLIEVRLSSKCTLFLTHSELIQLLKYDPAIYQRAIERGKHILRGRRQSERERAKFEFETKNLPE